MISLGRRKHFPTGGRAVYSDGILPLVVLVGCFFVGAAGGLLFAFFSTDGTALKDYLVCYFADVGAVGVSVDFWSAFWEISVWPIIAFCCGFLRAGVIVIPLLLSARGFMLCFSIARIAHLLHVPGLWVSLSLFGVASFLALPALFVICYHSFRSSRSLIYGDKGVYFLSRERIAVSLLAMGALTFAVLVHQMVMPGVLSAICAAYF